MAGFFGSKFLDKVNDNRHPDPKWINYCVFFLSKEDYSRKTSHTKMGDLERAMLHWHRCQTNRGPQNLIDEAAKLIERNSGIDKQFREEAVTIMLRMNSAEAIEEWHNRHSKMASSYKMTAEEMDAKGIQWKGPEEDDFGISKYLPRE